MNKTKWILSAVMALALVAAVSGLTGCSQPAPEASTKAAMQYTCTMHPEVVKDAPGKCPKCGMDLTVKK